MDEIYRGPAGDVVGIATHNCTVAREPVADPNNDDVVVIVPGGFRGKGELRNTKFGKILVIEGTGGSIPGGITFQAGQVFGGVSGSGASEMVRIQWPSHVPQPSMFNLNDL
jgi:hypothetical protein